MTKREYKYHAERAFVRKYLQKCYEIVGLHKNKMLYNLKLWNDPTATINSN